MSLAKNIIGAVALTSVLAMTHFGAVHAGDGTSAWRPMKPLHAINFDVGRKHVLSYFLKKKGVCDLTMVVSDRPDVAPRGSKLPSLQSVRFEAVIEGGKKARFDTAEGNSLEYTCPIGAHVMTVRALNQVALSTENRK